MAELVKSKSNVKSITSQCRNIMASRVFTPRREGRSLYCNHGAIGCIVGFSSHNQAELGSSPTNAGHSVRCTRAGASSFPTHGALVAPVICKGLDLRHWRQPAPATPIQ